MIPSTIFKEISEKFLILNLGNNHMGEMDMGYFLEFLQKTRTLSWLDCSSMKGLNANMVGTILNSMATNPGIPQFTVYFNSIGDFSNEQARPISDVIYASPLKMIAFHFNNNNLDDIGIQYMLAAGLSNPNLKTFSLNRYFFLEIS